MTLPRSAAARTGTDPHSRERRRLTQCMVRPRVARGFVDLVVSGLASMYPVSSWSCFAPDHHGYQRACVLISGQASTGPFGSPVFACAGKTDPPSLLIPLADLGWKLLIALRHRLLLISPSSFVRANGRSFVPACRRRSRRAQGRSRPAVTLGLLRAPRCQAAP